MKPNTKPFVDPDTQYILRYVGLPNPRTEAEAAKLADFPVNENNGTPLVDVLLEMSEAEQERRKSRRRKKR